MNSCNFVGRLAGDVRKGNNVSNFTLAVQRPFKNKKTGDYDADFISMVAFGKLSEIINDYAAKGMLVSITGRFQNNHHQDSSGNMQYSEQIVVNEFRMLESRKNQSNNDKQANNNQPDPFAKNSDNIDIKESDMPF